MTTSDKEKIREFALKTGFSACGFTEAKSLESQGEILKSWLKNSYHADMNYMSRNFEIRLNPSLLVKDARTIIVLIYNYFPSETQKKGSPLIAKYAYGKDYHVILKNKMNEIFSFIKQIDKSCKGRCFVDSAPVFERQYAVEAGLGWIGKNSCLVNKCFGSYVFISEIIINKEIPPDSGNEKSYCGNCTKCIDNCPTGAIVSPSVIDSRKCISYHTIESKNDVPAEIDEKNPGYIYGCDICQDVCPWNSKLNSDKFNLFQPIDEIINFEKTDWQNLKEDDFKRIFKESPMFRTGFKKIKKELNRLSL